MVMQGYVTLDTRDLPRAVKFYDRIARELGSRRSLESDDCVAWGLPGAPAAISVEAPEHGRMAACGTEVVALQAADPEQVQRLYDLAIAQGGRGEAEPSERDGYYAACFRDPDGNRLNAFCVTQH
jgi:catechol 2,3-dioxygenase-like lactoylglutathione lyase family enzyme